MSSDCLLFHVPWEGYAVRTRCDAGTAFKLIELARDNDVSASAKAVISANLLFVDAERVFKEVKDIGGLVNAALESEELFGKSGDGERVIDWDADSDYIKASVWQTYGLSLGELSRKTTMAELAKLVGMCPHETPIGQALYYRTAKPPKRTKYNDEEVSGFYERKRFWALRGEEPSQDDALTMAGESLVRAIRSRR